MSLRIRRGTDAQRSSLPFDSGELIYTTDTKRLYVGDGVTQGGVDPMAGLAGVGLHYNTSTGLLDANYSSLTTDSIAEGVQAGKQYFTAERAQDAAAYLFTHGTHTNISFTYDDSGTDGQGKINATVTLDGVGIANVEADTTPALGGNLSLNSHDITGTGNIDIDGGINITGVIKVPAIIASAFTNDETDINTLGVKFVTAAGNDVSANFHNGTNEVPTQIVPGDAVGTISIKGYNGTDYVFGGGVFAVWDGTANTSTLYPSSTIGLVAGNNSTEPVVATLNSSGTFSAPSLQTGVYVTTPSDTRPDGVKGMIIFNDTSGKFQGYDGFNWVDIS
jgi:hypothetical protein